MAAAIWIAAYCRTVMPGHCVLLRSATGDTGPRFYSSSLRLLLFEQVLRVTTAEGRDLREREPFVVHPHQEIDGRYGRGFLHGLRGPVRDAIEVVVAFDRLNFLERFVQ